jgi:hypothetical protein
MWSLVFDRDVACVYMTAGGGGGTGGGMSALMLEAGELAETRLYVEADWAVAVAVAAVMEDRGDGNGSGCASNVIERMRNVCKDSIRY